MRWQWRRHCAPEPTSAAVVAAPRSGTDISGGDGGGCGDKRYEKGSIPDDDSVPEEDFIPDEGGNNKL